jgi:anti-sigma factor RsiW
MNEHDEKREWLALAAAGGLNTAEERELAAHLAICASCAAEMESWTELASALRRLPTPQAPAPLLERVREQLAAHSYLEAERRQTRRVVAWLVLFAWTVTLASWPLYRLLSNEAADLLNVQFLHTWYGLFAVTVSGWIAAAVAAALVALRHRQERGFA